MKDAESWRGVTDEEAQASSLQQALMYSNVPDNYHASIADPSSPFLPCWNDKFWLHASQRAEDIHAISPPSLVVDTGTLQRQQEPSMIHFTHPSSSELLQHDVRGASHDGGLWKRPDGSSPVASRIHKKLVMQDLEQYSNHNIPGSMSRVSNSLQLGYNNPFPTAAGKGIAAAAAAYGASIMCDKLLLQASSAGAGALQGSSQFVEPTGVLGMHAIDDSAQDCGIQGLLHLQQHPPQQQIQLPVVPDIVGAIETRGLLNTGLGFSPSGNKAAVSNVWEMQQQNSIKSFETGLGFSPNGNEAAVTNMCCEMQQQQMSIVAGMKRFNPGPYVSSAAAVGEAQDVALAGCSRAWFENKSNTAVPVGFDVTHQLGGYSTQQHVAGLQQQSGALASSGIKWPSRVSSIPAALPATALPVSPVLSGHTGLRGGMDGKTSIVMQSEEDLPALKGALLPRCPPAASGNTIFIDSHKRPISSQGDAAFQGSFQNAGKKPAAGGTPWSGQGACSRFEYLSTVAHKQVSQSTASGSSRALGPALNTDTKPLAHQGSANNDLQTIAAQNAGKKPAAAGGMPWSGGGQDSCSRFEYLSTAAHKQVSRSTASGSSSRALGPALNTNLKPRARQGSANDPQSVAARVRRERITERLKYLQNLIPNGDKVDMVTMLEKAINYVQCLELQIRMLKDDSLWPKALGALPNTLQELQELAGPEIAGQGQCKSDIVESEPKVSMELVEKDRANPSSSHS